MTLVERLARIASSRLGRVLVVALTVLVAGCTSAPDAHDRPLLIATTTIVGDLAAYVAGEEARVEVLMPAGADPHDFQLSARQAARVREADLVVTSGLGLEEGLQKTLDSARADGTRILELGAHLAPRVIGESLTPDPHWWLDPIRAARAVRLIGDRLGEVRAGDWSERAETAAARLRELDAELRALFATIAPDRRKLITTHDAFRYFAERYDFQIVGVVIGGGSTHAAPSPQELAELAAAIRRSGVPAVFGETTLPTRDAETLAREAGTAVKVVVLHTGSLGEPGSGADSYIEMMRVNAGRIVDALR